MSLMMRQPRGFTLIELMCSIAISTIVLLTAAVVLRSSGEGYERVGGSLAADREARAILGQLSSDLATAQYHPDTMVQAGATAWPSDRLGFLALQPGDAQSDPGRIGDLCAIHYYLKEVTVNGRTVRCLMRGFRESAETFKALAAGSAAPLFTERQQVDEPLAFGVVSFEARPKSLDSAGKWVDWTANPLKGPEALDVRVVIARRDLAGMLAKPGDWDGGSAGAARLLGNPADAARNPKLEIHGTLIRFGNHEKS